jgi:hypothetical protein
VTLGCADRSVTGVGIAGAAVSFAVDIITGLAGLVFTAANEAGVALFASGAVSGGVGELGPLTAGRTGAAVDVVVAAVLLALDGVGVVGIVATVVVGEDGVTGVLGGVVVVVAVVAVVWAGFAGFVDDAGCAEARASVLPDTVGVAAVGAGVVAVGAGAADPDALVPGADALDDGFPGVEEEPLDFCPAELTPLSVDCPVAWFGELEFVEVPPLACPVFWDVELVTPVELC